NKTQRDFAATARPIIFRRRRFSSPTNGDLCIKLTSITFSLLLLYLLQTFLITVGCLSELHRASRSMVESEEGTFSSNTLHHVNKQMIEKDG
ncbi:hypothetical protein Ccrd_021793, partial [Cynara cardunculus var. scolymus]